MRQTKLIRFWFDGQQWFYGWIYLGNPQVICEDSVIVSVFCLRFVGNKCIYASPVDNSVYSGVEHSIKKAACYNVLHVNNMLSNTSRNVLTARRLFPKTWRKRVRPRPLLNIARYQRYTEFQWWPFGGWPHIQKSQRPKRTRRNKTFVFKYKWFWARFGSSYTSWIESYLGTFWALSRVLLPFE